MKTATLIFPHHLFEKHPGLSKDNLLCFIEDPLFFYDSTYKAKFHKKKLMFHRISMKRFFHHLQDKGYDVAYLEAKDLIDDKTYLENFLKKKAVTHCEVVEFDDYILEKRIKHLLAGLHISLKVHPSPGFLSGIIDFKDIFRGKSEFFFHSFYIEQRKMLNILVDDNLKPVGGKWSFDTENRKKTPKDLEFPQPMRLVKPKEHDEAVEYVEDHFDNHPGNIENFHYPTSHSEARRALEDFLANKLKSFGDYEDAIHTDEPVLFHSVLSPLLNSGLITPDTIVNRTLEFAAHHKTSMNSLEGFLRQVIGWREFIRGVYHVSGTKQRNSNYFKHKTKMPECFYDGTSGIPPIDDTIKKLNDTAYSHHIERLMVLGNFFLLCEIDPDDIYKWFMEMFIDSYDWVMVPNVYGMSQYADGGLMTTKPYISGSNYILKMSNYPKGEWCEIWDGLFWRFMIKHLHFFEKQPRLNMLCSMAKNKKNDKELLNKANKFLERLS
ncbi:MAG: cryptochrome/photolyase family protein [Chlamydiae bacterium]|nr:cryptochrome/photolyase family protein [Chlamydiota bacterium]